MLPEDLHVEQPLVLITDDNDQARILLRRIFQRESFRAEEANSGQVAIEKARAMHPDLILMDIQMPGMDGFEAVRILREDPLTERIPIIVVTAKAREPEDITKGIGLGADDYLTKPYNASELMARARAKIKARQLEDKLHQRSQELETLVQIGHHLNAVLELDTLAESLIQAVMARLPATVAALVVLDAEGRVAYYSSNGAGSNGAGEIAPGSLPHWVLRHNIPNGVNNLATTGEVQAIIEGNEAQSGLAVPIHHSDQMLGVLVVGHVEPETYTARHLRLLESIGVQAGMAIRNAQFYGELQAYAHNLESMVEARTQALQAAQVQLVRADKLAALGTLAAGVAHEVNNPLQPVLTNLEMTLEDIDDGKQVDRELLDFARKEVQRIKRIVTRLLDFARPSKPDMLPTNINEMVNDVMTLTAKQLEHSRVKVKTILAATRPVMGNADQIRQVILNLVVNAMDAMRDGGTLTIQTADARNELTLTVHDTGTGIPPEQISQIFDPFFTTKSSGTGLGLSVSYGIIQGHGGQISVDSKVGEYAAFTIRLPVIND